MKQPERISNQRERRHKQIEYQQLQTRIRNLTAAYLLHKQPIQFILLEKYCLQRDQLKQQLKQRR
jgi:hypothetical protein